MTISSPRGGGNRTMRKKSSSSSFPLGSTMAILICCFISFYAGTLWSLSAGIMDCHTSNRGSTSKSGGTGRLFLQSQRNILEKLIMDYHNQKEDNTMMNGNTNNDADNDDDDDEGETEKRLFPTTTSKYAVGMGTVTKEKFFETFDIGVSYSQPDIGDNDVLILYNLDKTLPSSNASLKESLKHSITHIDDVHDAVENCDFMNVYLTYHDRAKTQCLAIVPQYEAYHIFRYGRVDIKGNVGKVKKPINRNAPLSLISRGYEANGRNNFVPPSEKIIKSNWAYLRTFLGAIDTVMEELRPILTNIAVRNTVIVMVCNFGQSELLMNFACMAKSRQFDTSMIIVFATDPETNELAQSLGLTSYYDERNFERFSKHEANVYGDRFFVQMMMAKAIVTTLVSILGFDFIFQDVDVVWYKHPLDFFHKEYNKFQDFDMFFQDDGGHSQRYAPLSANTGFYYVKHNDKTQFLFSSVLLNGDLIQKSDSHQQALIAKMNDYVSLLALQIKIINRDDDELPGGYHYHQKSGKYLRSMFAGEKHPVIFHMSWTKNKDNKLLFFRQMGEWYVQDTCIQKTKEEIILMGGGGGGNNNNDLSSMCCSSEPLFSCHYRDKPSIKPCKDSPPIDAGAPSWWK